MSSELNATAGSMLGLLAWKPMSGWELYASFEDSIGHFWSLTRSQVYRELQALAARGLIEIGTSGARERRVCTITDAGRGAFSAWIAQMPGEEQIRFPLLLTTFFGASVRPEVLREASLAHRATHAARLAGYEAQLPEIRTHAPYGALALEFGIAYERTVLAWIDGLPWMQAPRSS
jgi:DNA-binding PadR family transcriptional regulator